MLNNNNLALPDIINPEEWQVIQDSLSEVLEITLHTISKDGNPISSTSRPLKLCRDIFKHPEPCLYFLLDSKVEGIKEIKSETRLKCPFDLDVFIMPIETIGIKIIAYVVLGPVMLKARKNMAEYAQEAQRLGVKLDELEDALIDINVFSYNKISEIIKLVKGVFSYMAQAGHHKKRLGEIVPEVVELDPLFSKYYEEKLLRSLLKSCTLALEADSGSVMTVDKKTNMLHIKAASKLDENVVNSTETKIGEGIAGIAVATAEPIILPQDKDKKGLSAKMKRGYIHSSLIVPFTKGDSHDVYGVINLNIVRKDREFSNRDVLLLKELVNMARIALIPLKKES